jgi:hypothetical protein
LGKTYWKEEEQHFFLAEATSGVAEIFEYQVTGEGIDTGFRYQYRWLEVGPNLRNSLVQGANSFVTELITEIGAT